jgi:hypothetical protein
MAYHLKEVEALAAVSSAEQKQEILARVNTSFLEMTWRQKLMMRCPVYAPLTLLCIQAIRLEHYQRTVHATLLSALMCSRTSA